MQGTVSIGWLMLQERSSVVSAGMILQGLIGTGVLALIGLNWKLRDSVRDLVAKVGSSEEKGTLLHRVDGLEFRTERIEDRNKSIDIVMKQYVRDMRNMGRGGGRRASDEALQEAVELAFDSPDEPQDHSQQRG